MVEHLLVHNYVSATFGLGELPCPSCVKATCQLRRALAMADDLRGVRDDLRRARDRQRKRALRNDDATGLTKTCLDTALCIGLLADCDLRAGAAWLESPQRRGLPLKNDTSMDDVLESLRSRFLESDLDELDALRDPEHTPLTPSQFACAARVAEEYKLGLWVRARNLAGASVRTPTLIAEFQTRLEARPPPVQLTSVPQTEDRRGRNWAFRWRRSQGGAFRNLRTEEPISTEEKREKAGRWSRARLVFSEISIGGGRGLQNRHPRQLVSQPHGSRKHPEVAPFFGFRFWPHV